MIRMSFLRPVHVNVLLCTNCCIRVELCDVLVYVGLLLAAYVCTYMCTISAVCVYLLNVEHLLSVLCKFHKKLNILCLQYIHTYCLLFHLYFKDKL